MKIIEASVEIWNPEEELRDIPRRIERAGRVCYKSEGKITEGSADTFCRGIIKRGHEAVLEHSSVTVKFIVDRGVSHEIVRHRVASFCQESTRYCNYSKDQFCGEITVIKPLYFDDKSEGYRTWEESCKQAESKYFDLLNYGCSPQQARAVLPNSLKTEVVMTANIREWRHFLKLRCSQAAHPQIRVVSLKLLARFKEIMPVLFEDIGV